MVVKTPEQLEDAAIADVIRSAVGIRTRQMGRELQSQLAEKLEPKVRLARLQGKRVDLAKLFGEVTREVAATK